MARARGTIRGRPETRRPSPARFVPAPAAVAPERLAGVGRILLIRLRAMGDVVLATPVARALRRRFTGAEIVMMTDDLWTPILEGCEGLDDILAHPKRDRSRGVRNGKQTLELAREIRRRRFDLVVDLFGNPRSAMLTAVSGARLRLGYDVRGRRHAYNIRQPRHVLTDGEARLKYAALVNIDMVRRLGAEVDDPLPRLTVSRAEGEAARARLAALGVGPRERIVGLLPSGSWPSKTWPEERFARLGDLLAGCPGVRVLILWGPGEDKVARRVAARMETPALIAPPLGLRELMGFLASIDLFAGNDSGPRHLAAALGTSTLSVYGPTNPATWHPPAGPHAAVSAGVPCGPCDRTACSDLRCLLAITPERVARVAVAMLDRAA